MDRKVLVFATHNAHKAREIQQLVGDRYVVKTLTDIGCLEDIAETGDTLEENASIKSSYIARQYGLDCFADDTGLEVDALNGSPGVYSARYAGSQRSDEDNMSLLLHNLKDTENRRARFRTVISLIVNGVETTFEGILEGNITWERSGENGFGYDPVFRPLDSDMTLAQMNASEKNAISHRAKATAQLIAFLNSKS